LGPNAVTEVPSTRRKRKPSHWVSNDLYDVSTGSIKPKRTKHNGTKDDQATTTTKPDETFLGEPAPVSILPQDGISVLLPLSKSKATDSPSNNKSTDQQTATTTFKRESAAFDESIQTVVVLSHFEPPNSKDALHQMFSGANGAKTTQRKSTSSTTTTTATATATAVISPPFQKDSYPRSFWFLETIVWAKLSGYPWWPGQVNKTISFVFFFFLMESIIEQHDC
jgi:hypothetical protein